MVICGSNPLLDNPPVSIESLMLKRPDLRGVNVVADVLTARWVA